MCDTLPRYADIIVYEYQQYEFQLNIQKIEIELNLGRTGFVGMHQRSVSNEMNKSQASNHKKFTICTIEHIEHRASFNIRFLESFYSHLIQPSLNHFQSFGYLAKYVQLNLSQHFSHTWSPSMHTKCIIKLLFATSRYPKIRFSLFLM